MIMKATGTCRMPWRGVAGIIVLPMLAVPSWFSLSAEPTAAPGAKAEWIVYVEDGLTGPHAVDLLPASTPLENYTANLARISRGFSEERYLDLYCSAPGAYDPENITVTEIGPWHGYTVFDLVNIPAKHRSIVLKDQQGNHRILYTQVCGGTATMDDTPHLVTVQDETLLFYRSECGGSGGFDEYYFLYDPATRQPILLSLDPIQAKIQEIIPKDRIIWDSGGFKVATLTYTTPVWWKESDAHCCPTAGRVTMKLEIRDKALVVTETKYDPDYRYRHEESHDKAGKG